MDIKGNFSDFSELSSIGLARGGVASIENGRGLVLRVETGSVWLTQDRSSKDVLLEAGASFQIERDGSTVLSALGPRFALVSIEPSIPVTPTFAERFWAFWASLYSMPSRPAMVGL
mgnify:CR=1 FL=1